MIRQDGAIDMKLWKHIRMCCPDFEKAIIFYLEVIENRVKKCLTNHKFGSILDNDQEVPT